ncbi:hypothetical protein PQY68_05765 [Planktomarina temperata]|nr:hypothetical protein [Planktomarina temperata]MDC6454735.1 hypothetical protein [Planktomarina temperata]
MSPLRARMMEDIAGVVSILSCNGTIIEMQRGSSKQHTVGARSNS